MSAVEPVLAPPRRGPRAPSRGCSVPSPTTREAELRRARRAPRRSRASPSPNTNTRLPVRYVESTEREYHGSRARDATSSASDSPSVRPDECARPRARSRASRRRRSERRACIGCPNDRSSHCAVDVAIFRVEHDVEVRVRQSRDVGHRWRPTARRRSPSTPRASSSSRTSRTSSRGGSPTTWAEDVAAPATLAGGERGVALRAARSPSVERTMR